MVCLAPELVGSLVELGFSVGPVGAAGSGPLAGKLVPKHPEWSVCQLSTPSSQDVSGGEEESTPELPFVACCFINSWLSHM